MTVELLDGCHSHLNLSLAGWGARSRFWSALAIAPQMPSAPSILMQDTIKRLLQICIAPDAHTAQLERFGNQVLLDHAVELGLPDVEQAGPVSRAQDLGKAKE